MSLVRISHCLLVFDFVPHPTVLRAYSCLCNQGSFLVGLGDRMECQDGTWLGHVRQVSCPLHRPSGPSFCICLWALSGLLFICLFVFGFGDCPWCCPGLIPGSVLRPVFLGRPCSMSGLSPRPPSAHCAAVLLTPGKKTHSLKLLKWGSLLTSGSVFPPYLIRSSSDKCQTICCVFAVEVHDCHCIGSVNGNVVGVSVPGQACSSAQEHLLWPVWGWEFCVIPSTAK